MKGARTPPRERDRVSASCGQGELPAIVIAERRPVVRSELPAIVIADRRPVVRR